MRPDRLDRPDRPDQPGGQLRRALRRAVAVTLPLMVVLALRLPSLGLAVRLWLVALGAIAIAALVERSVAGVVVADPQAGRLRRGWWRRPPAERVRPLEELERAVEFSLATAFDVHYRLRPHLQRVALDRLAARGVSLDMQPGRAQALLGRELWDLVRPDRPEPEDRAGPGLPLAVVRRVVERLDEL